MITLEEFYSVMSAIVPLYVAMILAYGSVRWWKILTPDQCSGINRFVAIFAVPLLSFQIIAHNNPYTMNVRFITADALQKLFVLAVLGLWARLSTHGSLEWLITLFMLATLPNTLVLGVPLLNAMYGPNPANLVVQAVVLQCVVWYTLLLFMYEYRSARLLVMQSFPKPAASIVSVRVDSDVVSLDYKDQVTTEALVNEDGKIYVQVKRSPASSSMIQGLYSTASARTRELPGSVFDSKASTPGGSDLTNAELYSVHSSLTPGAHSFCSRGERNDFYLMSSSPFRVHDLDSLQSMSASPWDGGNVQSGRRSPLECKFAGRRTTPNIEEEFRQLVHERCFSHTAIQITKRETEEVAAHPGVDYDAKELQMFVWSASTSPKSPVSVGDYPAKLLWRREERLPLSHETAVEIPAVTEKTGRVIMSPFAAPTKQDATKLPEKDHDDMLSARVMTKLILNMVWKKLIRNPNTYSIIFGLAWALVSFRWNVQLPKIIEGSITILSNAGLGMAMFSLGLFMALQPKLLACGTSMTVVGMVIRFLTSPAIMSATSIAVGLRNLDLRASIIQAALPQGIVPFVFAKEYNVHPDILSTAVIFGMLVSLPITLLYYVLLGL